MNICEHIYTHTYVAAGETLALIGQLMALTKLSFVCIYAHTYVCAFTHSSLPVRDRWSATVFCRAICSYYRLFTAMLLLENNFVFFVVQRLNVYLLIRSITTTTSIYETHTNTNIHLIVTVTVFLLSQRCCFIIYFDYSQQTLDLVIVQEPIRKLDTNCNL